MVQGDPSTPPPSPTWGSTAGAGLVSFGHGFDHLDVDAATVNGVILANTASFGTEEVSNHALMLLLACARKPCCTTGSCARAPGRGSTSRRWATSPGRCWG